MNDDSARDLGSVMLGAALTIALTLTGCGNDSYEWNLPPGIPLPRVPADNPMSATKAELGRFLFYDQRLSSNGRRSCASCHTQADAFSDRAPFSLGTTDELTPRNSMSLTNVAYNSAQTWANPALVQLEDQALVPMFGEHPIELGLANMEAALLERLRADPDYPAQFRAAFPNDADPITVANVVRAIATFERTLLSFDSPYDRYTYRGDNSAMSASALRGQALFNSERLECFHCHGSYNFSDSVMHGGTVITEVQFHNNGLYNIDGRGAYPESNQGLIAHTGNPRDMGRFRAPTLRNIELTPPYMHDGSIETLEGVLDHYAQGGRTIETGPNAGVGSESPLKNAFLHGFELTPDERADVLAFLRSLTDRSFVENPLLADPRQTR